MSNKIKILPEILSNKIAAGEVVERPASVVKELVENALDAGSKRIRIDVEKGGRSLIRVSDNGTGMRRDDALLAIERYATSKIYKDQDLFAIQTLGFRGEALPSIASVSRFVLVTRDESSDIGTEIRIEGGKVQKVSDVGAPKGTMISVKQLFFNTPARRKFLKTINTEMSHIAEIVASTAIAHPSVRFTLTHNDKSVKDWPTAKDPADRIAEVLGKDTKNHLIAIESETEPLSISGWISSPQMTRRTSRGIYIYVNGRYVRDRTIQHALFAGYSRKLVKGQFPVAVLFINVPYDQVDVNVHPAKNEVRFAQQQQVHAAVQKAVAQALYEADRLQWQPAQFSQNTDPPTTGKVAETNSEGFGTRRVKFGFENIDSAFKPSNYKKDDVPTEYFSLTQTTRVPQPATRISQPVTLSSHHETRTPQPERRTQFPAPRTQQTSIWKKGRFRDLRIIGQFANTYIVCEAPDGLLIIDQHAAHERILFEQLCQQAQSGRRESQKLLVPEIIELSYRESDVLKKLIPDLEAMGLEIEPFGGNTFAVKAVPALLSQREVKPLIIEIVERIVDGGFAPGLQEALDQSREVIACHGAIRANQPLSNQQIKALLEQMDACENPSNCPHGRPTWLRWDLKSLEKLFKRIV